MDAAVKYDLIRLQGGMDQVTPTLSLAPGIARRASNFECSITGGYSRIDGYERFDGHASPSAARYNKLSCNLTGAVSVGNTIVGQSSASTGVVVAKVGNTLIITRESNSFVSGEGITVSSAVVGSIQTVNGLEADGLLDATYKGLAADHYRASISVVPGTGPIRGVAFYLNAVFAWRNNASATAAELYKSSSLGWVKVNFGKELGFTTGSVTIADGVTVTGASSGATGVVSRVVIQTGTFAAGTATGRLILSSSSGTFTASEVLKVAGTSRALASGPATQITMLPNGNFNLITANFGGGPAAKKLYGCDGVNRAFEFDGTTFVPLVTGMASDTPNLIQFHKQYLFLTFGASLQFCAIGNPYSWSVVLGAGEIVMNDNITNLLVMPGNQATGALGIFTRTDTSILYGTSTATFQLVSFNIGTGGILGTAQNLDQAYVLDDRGVISLTATLNYGNFDAASLTMNLKPFMDIHRNLATCSMLQRTKGQYRVFFSDGYGLYVTVRNSQMLGSMPVVFPDPVLNCVEGHLDDGSPVLFFGSSSGYVFQLDRGTSFDGQTIAANMTLVFNATKSPRILKRYRKASIEMTGNSYATIAFGYDLGYRTNMLDQAVDASYSNDLRSAYWDSFTWDNFVFDGTDISPSEIEVTGTAENMAIRVSSTSAILPTFTVNSIIVHYSLRRGLR